MTRKTLTTIDRAQDFNAIIVLAGFAICLAFAGAFSAFLAVSIIKVFI